MRKWLSGAAVASLSMTLLAALPARADTVFSDYNGSNCQCGFVSGIGAEGFTPSSDFDFTGAAAFLSDMMPPENVSLSLYSVSGGLPATELWSSGPLSITSASLYSATYSGPAIGLFGGTPYALAVNLGSTSVDWLNGGTSQQDRFYQDDQGSWHSNGTAAEQFEIYGDPVAAVPEPASIFLVAMGLVGIAAARRHRVGRAA